MSEQARHTQQWAIYNRLRELRRARGLSQKELAQQLGLGHRSIGYFERQDFEPDLRLAWRIADYFGVELTDVFFRDEYPPPAHIKERLASGQHEPHTSCDTASQSRQRPASFSILSALLDGYGADQEKLARRAGLDAETTQAELYSLREEGLVDESVKPGPVFGRPHSASYSLTSEGHKRIVEIHRNHLPEED